VKLVHCVADDKEWEAEEFNSLGWVGINVRRCHLVCIACGGKAFFRRTGPKARPAFGARHIKGCKVLTPGWTVFRYLQ